MTADEIRERLKDMEAYCHGRSMSGGPDFWPIWETTCREAVEYIAEAQRLLQPPPPVRCSLCGEAYDVCQCEKPF